MYCAERPSTITHSKEKIEFYSLEVFTQLYKYDADLVRQNRENKLRL
jgi:hypothetical protein